MIVVVRAMVGVEGHATVRVALRTKAADGNTRATWRTVWRDSTLRWNIHVHIDNHEPDDAPVFDMGFIGGRRGQMQAYR